MHKAQPLPRFCHSTLGQTSTHMCFYRWLFSPLFFGCGSFNKTHTFGKEHYGTIADIVAIFKVTDKDTCLFVRNSHTVFYSNGIRSAPFQKG